MDSEGFVRRRQQAEDAVAMQQLNATRQQFNTKLVTLIPVVIAGLRARGFPQTPRDVFCLGQYSVNDTQKLGYYLGGHGADFTDLILCINGTLAFGGKTIAANTLATVHKFTERDTLDVIDKLNRMLELAPPPKDALRRS